MKYKKCAHNREDHSKLVSHSAVQYIYAVQSIYFIYHFIMYVYSLAASSLVRTTVEETAKLECYLSKDDWKQVIFS